MPAEKRPLPAPVTKVLDELRGLGCVGVPTRVTDGQSAARSALPDGAASANTQLFEADGRPVLVVVSGRHRADPVNLAGVLGVMSVRPVPDPIATLWTGQAPTAIAPVGHAAPIAVIIDVELSQHQRIWVPAGHPDYMFPTSYAELLRITAGQAAEVGELPEPGTTPTIQA